MVVWRYYYLRFMVVIVLLLKLYDLQLFNLCFSCMFVSLYRLLVILGFWIYLWFILVAYAWLIVVYLVGCCWTALTMFCDFATIGVVAWTAYYSFSFGISVLFATWLLICCLSWLLGVTFGLCMFCWDMVLGIYLWGGICCYNDCRLLAQLFCFACFDLMFAFVIVWRFLISLW